MKPENYLPVLLVLVVLSALAAYFPPSKFSWHRFFADHAPIGQKMSFLSKIYAVPAGLSFCAVVLFQLQMRMSMWGAPVNVVFPMAVLGATSMLGAFRSMAAGVGGVPGYALGMATAYTMRSRFYINPEDGRPPAIAAGGSQIRHWRLLLSAVPAFQCLQQHFEFLEEQLPLALPRGGGEVTAIGAIPSPIF